MDPFLKINCSRPADGTASISPVLSVLFYEGLMRSNSNLYYINSDQKLGKGAIVQSECSFLFHE